MRLLVLSNLILLSACTVTADTRPLVPHPEDRTGAHQRGLVVHEWGTYTSVQSSEGKTMQGLHHAEELLPSFVHARDPLNPDHKGVDARREPVTQKLETPVIYFYGQADRVDVQVRFPSGLISEWYPRAASFSPPLTPAPVPLSGGAMRWNLELVAPDPAGEPSVSEDSVWAPSRRVRALGVKNGGEQERFIFYRGLARFERPLYVRARGRDAVVVVNDSDEAISSAFLLRKEGELGRLVEVGAIGARQEKVVAIEAPLTPIERHHDQARRALARELEASGLYSDEALAMVDTWRHSYFLNDGTRLLYIAPRAWTDELLPLEVTPAPVELVRTLVGRIEVMLATEEEAMVEEVTRWAGGKGILFPHDHYGRFTEPKLRRALELVEGVYLRDYVQRSIDLAAQLP